MAAGQQQDLFVLAFFKTASKDWLQRLHVDVHSYKTQRYSEPCSVLINLKLKYLSNFSRSGSQVNEELSFPTNNHVSTFHTSARCRTSAMPRYPCCQKCHPPPPHNAPLFVLHEYIYQQSPLNELPSSVLCHGAKIGGQKKSKSSYLLSLHIVTTQTRMQRRIQGQENICLNSCKS